MVDRIIKIEIPMDQEKIVAIGKRCMTDITGTIHSPTNIHTIVKVSPK